jgi:hypothetical protein
MEEMRKAAPMEPVWSTISAGQEAKKEILGYVYSCVGVEWSLPFKKK